MVSVKRERDEDAVSVHWPPLESAFYEELLKKNDGKLSYRLFLDKWPAHYTPRTKLQCYSKTRIIKRAAEKLKAKQEQEQQEAGTAAAAPAAVEGAAAATGGGRQVVVRRGSSQPGRSTGQTTLTLPAAAAAATNTATDGVLEGKRRSPQTEKGREYHAQMQGDKRRRMQ